MGTQALITYIGNDDKPVLKIVAGSNGDEYASVIQALQRLVNDGEQLTLEQVHKVASKFLGTLIVIGRTRHVTDMDEEDLHPRWRKTFNKPWFNPRWDEGTAAYSAVIRCHIVEDGS